MSDAVLRSTLSSVSSQVSLAFESSGIQVDSPLSTSIAGILDSHSDAMSALDTPYRISSLLQSTHPIVSPVRMELGTHLGTVRRKGITVLENIKEEVYRVPLLESLSQVLSNSEIRAQVMSGPHQMIGPVYGDICDGELFQEHMIFSSNPQALQIILYYDELQVANPLGAKSKSNKLGAGYYTLGNLEPAQRSRLDTIFLAAIFDCRVADAYCIDTILEPIYEEIRQLSQPEGLQLCICEEMFKFQGALLAFVGDTPASHKVGGFKEGVGVAERKCRHCVATLEDIQVKFVEEEFTLRTKAVHHQHCSMVADEGNSRADRQHYSKTYGINRMSGLTLLEPFDVTEQLPEDVMHILLEGVVPAHTGLFLKEILLDLPRAGVSLEWLNSKVKMFPYGYFEADKKPSPIPPATIQEGDLTSKQSASQMWCLLHILPLILGDTLSSSDPHYECFLQLHDICSIVLSPVIAHEQVPYLRVLIRDYLVEFKGLYNKRLTPKFHYLVHLPRQIMRLGPPVRLWAMRFEGKNKALKQMTRGTSYKNICWTIAMKQQQSTAHTLLSAPFSTTRAVEFGTATRVLVSDLGYINQLDVPAVDKLNPGNLFRYNFVQIHGTVYRRQCWVLIGQQRIGGVQHPKFGVIEDIISTGPGRAPLFVIRPGITVSYIEHMRAHTVTTQSSTSLHLLHPSSLLHYEPCSSMQHGLDTIVKARTDLTPYLSEC